MLVNEMADIRMSRAGGEDVDQASGTVNEQAETIDREQAETVYEQVQVETVDERSLDTVETRAKQTMAERVEQGEGPVYANRTVYQGGGAAYELSSGSVESRQVTSERTVERVRIRWGSNNSKKYDGKVEDVPAQWVVDGSLTVGRIVTVNVGGEKTWAGTVMELLYRQNPLDLALPIKRTRHQSPVCCTFCLQAWVIYTIYCLPAPTSPPLATSTPTSGFAADLDDEDTSALLESLCSLPSSPRESVFSYDNHPPRNNLWPQQLPPHILPRVDIFRQTSLHLRLSSHPNLKILELFIPLCLLKVHLPINFNQLKKYLVTTEGKAKQVKQLFTWLNSCTLGLI